MRVERFSLLLGLALIVGASPRAHASSAAAGPWPMTSEHPVEPLLHPTLEQRLEALGDRVQGPVRLIAYGDQRALADGEWQAMITHIRTREHLRRDEPPLLAVIDTGDIVFDGSRSDQFHMLTGILEPLRDHPYLVAVGNHEVHNNEPGPARENVVRLLGPGLGEEFTTSRMYYAREAAGVRMIFLDTNDLVYGPDGDSADQRGLTYRGRAQLAWLSEQLALPTPARTTIVVMHHPFVSSSKMHRGQASKLWSLAYEGRTLPQMLAEGGVSLVLAGHTHTYERYRLTAPGGGSFELVNVSGRPRNEFLWFSAGKRRARDIAGEELETFADHGWRDLDGWTVEQLDAMLDDEANQWIELRIDPDGTIAAEPFFLVDEGREGAASRGSFVVGEDEEEAEE